VRASKASLAVAGLVVAGVMPIAMGAGVSAGAGYGPKHIHIDCSHSAATCAEVSNSAEVFGPDNYVGHDEPSVHFFSDVPGSGNHLQYQMTLPTNPSTTNPNTPGKSYTTLLYNSVWFGMTMCDTQSYPEQVSHCTPDSNTNIVDPAFSPKHPGAAFMELQLYPPGWVQWPTWAVAVGTGGCDPTRWCAALNIDSLLEDPVTGTLQNATCAARIGVEPINFAFLTKNGASLGPANPVDSTLATFTPDPSRVFFMNSGDKISVSLTDTANGLRTAIHDNTTGTTGFMTASASNGFAQIKYDPTGTSCDAIPYNFHPMYSTSSEKTILPWGADQDSISFTDEIGHFQYCNGPTAIPASPFGLDSSGNPITCPSTNTEEIGVNKEPTDSDDDFCFPGSEAPVIHLNGCTDTNTGFDGVQYTPVWPDGNTRLHPTPLLLSSPQTGSGFTRAYSRAGFEVDLPDIEYAGGGQPCDRSTGSGCTLIPITDDGQPAQFYPFFSTTSTGAGCMWEFGNHVPGDTNDFGRNAQYGTALNANYTLFGGGGVTVTRYDSFRQILANNPC
jgi:hypothetical protein